MICKLCRTTADKHVRAQGRFWCPIPGSSFGSCTQQFTPLILEREPAGDVRSEDYDTWKGQVFSGGLA